MLTASPSTYRLTIGSGALTPRRPLGASNQSQASFESTEMFGYILIAIIVIPMAWIVIQIFREDTKAKKAKK